MDTMRSAFGLPVGLSDHTLGIAVSIAAAARGAAVIEKHFTLNRNLPGPDHKASLEPGELKEMVLSIRRVEKALGSPCKVPAPSELRNRDVARKSLVAARSIKKGEPFTESNLTVKRPGNGIPPVHYWDWLGKAADRDYEQDEKLKT
jgi:N-acetylneuraminate synthase